MDGMSFEEAWRGEDGLSLRYKERLILALEDILFCVEVNGGALALSNIGSVAEWWSTSQRDRMFMLEDVTKFVLTNSVPLI